MSLVLSTNVTFPRDGKSLNFYEITGVYDVVNNRGGYGTPNDLVSACSVYSVKITPPDSTTAYTINPGFFLAFPSNVVTFKVGIPNTELGFTTNDLLPDGIYTVEYTILNTLGGQVRAVEYFLNLTNVLCCLDKKILNIKTADCDCSGQDIDKLLLAYILTEAASSMAACGDFDGVTERMKFLNDYCSFNDCKDC